VSEIVAISAIARYDRGRRPAELKEIRPLAAEAFCERAHPPARQSRTRRSRDRHGAGIDLLQRFSLRRKYLPVRSRTTWNVTWSMEITNNPTVLAAVILAEDGRPTSCRLNLGGALSDDQRIDAEDEGGSCRYDWWAAARGAAQAQKTRPAGSAGRRPRRAAPGAGT
jgi:hypothetical protein